MAETDRMPTQLSAVQRQVLTAIQATLGETQAAWEACKHEENVNKLLVNGLCRPRPKRFVITTAAVTELTEGVTAAQTSCKKEVVC